MKDRRPTPPRTRHRRAHSHALPHAAPAASLSEDLPRLCRGCLWGGILCVLLLIGSSALAASLLCMHPDPMQILGSVGAALWLLCALLGGLVVGRVGGARFAVSGFAYGLVLLLISLAASTLLGAAPLFSTTTVWLLRVAAVVFCLLGSYLGAHLPTRRVRGRR